MSNAYKTVENKVQNFFEQKLKEKIGIRNFLYFFQDVLFQTRQNNILKIITNSQNSAKNIADKFLCSIEDIVKENWSGYNISIKLSYFENNNEIDFDNIDNLKQDQLKNNIIKFHEHKNNFNFTNFIGHSSNLEALQVCKSIACAITEQLIDPGSVIYLNGSSCGKTHLIKAIENYYTSVGGKAFYTNATNLMRTYVDAIKKGDAFFLYDKILSHEIILIDDIDELIGRNGTSNAVLKIVNQACERGKYVVLTSCKSSNEISNASQAIKSLIANAIEFNIKPIDNELKRKIIINDILQNDYNIPLSILDSVLSRFTGTIIQLKAAIKKLSIIQSVKKYELNSDLALELLSEHLEPTENRGGFLNNDITCENIIKVVANFYSLESEFLKSKIKSANVSFARKVAAYLIYNIKHITYHEIGIKLCKSHSSIIESVKKIEQMISTDKSLAGQIASIKAAINSYY
jgi:chromosomal replication initiator protein